MSSRSQNFIDFFYQLNYSLSILSDRARGFDTTWKNIFYKILSNEWEFICSASLLIYDKWRRVKTWNHKHKVFWQDQKIYFSFILQVKKEKWKMDYFSCKQIFIRSGYCKLFLNQGYVIWISMFSFFNCYLIPQLNWELKSSAVLRAWPFWWRSC